jgi:hypothetical protein
LFIIPSAPDQEIAPPLSEAVLLINKELNKIFPLPLIEIAPPSLLELLINVQLVIMPSTPECLIVIPLLLINKQLEISLFFKEEPIESTLVLLLNVQLVIIMLPLYK